MDKWWRKPYDLSTLSPLIVLLGVGFMVAVISDELGANKRPAIVLGILVVVTVGACWALERLLRTRRPNRRSGHDVIHRGLRTRIALAILAEIVSVGFWIALALRSGCRTRFYACTVAFVIVFWFLGPRLFGRDEDRKDDGTEDGGVN